MKSNYSSKVPRLHTLQKHKRKIDLFAHHHRCHVKCCNIAVACTLAKRVRERDGTWAVFSPQRWAVAEPQQGELWSLASVIIVLSYRLPPPPPICAHYNAKPWHTIFPYALPLGSACSFSLPFFIFSFLSLSFVLLGSFLHLLAISSWNTSQLLLSFIFMKSIRLNDRSFLMEKMYENSPT